MITIRNYNNTKCELNIAKARLDFLMYEKEKIYTKYFPLTSKIKHTKDTGNEKKDKMANYLAELEKINPVTGMSLDQEIEEQRNIIGELEYCLKLMEYNFKQLKGEEAELYKLIADKGLGITKAVEKIAERKNKEVRSVWEYTYKKIEKEIKKLKKSSESSVKDMQ